MCKAAEIAELVIKPGDFPPMTNVEGFFFFSLLFSWCFGNIKLELQIFSPKIGVRLSSCSSRKWKLRFALYQVLLDFTALVLEVGLISLNLRHLRYKIPTVNIEASNEIPPFCLFLPLVCERLKQSFS